ncbi:hypothetical protein ACS0TY_011027 [Phlomoides rotata]
MGNMAVKIDMIKAFDTVAWDFLIIILERMGFSASFGGMVRSILASAHMSILINGIPVGHMLKVPKYLLYADNILFFAKACDSSIACLSDILSHYGELSGQVFSPMNLFDIFIMIDEGFPDVFLQATRLPFSKEVDNLWRVSFVTTIWALWHARNKLIFDDVKPIIRGTMMFVFAAIGDADRLIRGSMDRSVRELMITKSLGVVGWPKQRMDPIPVHWRPPQVGWYKANVDGSVFSAPGCMYVGVLFRNSRGFFVGAFCTRTRRGYLVEAELAAILHSILYAHSQGWHFLWVESDSILAVDTLLGKIPLVPWRLHILWCKVMVAASDMMIMYSHVYREANQAVDSLAKLQREAIWQHVCPDFLLPYLYRDVNTEYFCYNG